MVILKTRDSKGKLRTVKAKAIPDTISTEDASKVAERMVKGILAQRICKNCKWWQKEKRYNMGNCIQVMTEDGVPINLAAKAQAQDYEGYRGFLETEPDFGCNQWEVKEWTGQH